MRDPVVGEEQEIQLHHPMENKLESCPRQYREESLLILESDTISIPKAEVIQSHISGNHGDIF